MRLFTKIFCKLGMHLLVYRSSKTGIYLHPYYNGTPSISNWDIAKCEEECGFVQRRSNEAAYEIMEKNIKEIEQRIISLVNH